MVLAVIRATNSLILAIILVIVSKWRVFAVRPRYWISNVVANMVDYIVGIGYAIFLFSISAPDPQKAVIQLIIVIMYVFWLLFIKQQSKQKYIVIQSLSAVFIGINALALVSYDWPVSVFVIGMWVIGYSCSRHIILSYEEKEYQSLSYIVGFVFCELGWIFDHWMVAYTLPTVSMPFFSQIAVVITTLSYLFYKIYDYFFGKDSTKKFDLVLTTVFSLFIIIMLVFVFSGTSYNNI
jgi:hypothetical protein